ncbi:hypothetical protein [Crocosphaera sp. Alani8]|uniref:hypothetical protein n=1 Tax=Crocosphaera sp. Alani8 TaxID=3038952 RepID=UPI00313DC8E1
MTTQEKPLFTIAETPLLFSAVGCICGSFHSDEKGEESRFLHGILKTRDEREFRASVKRRDWEKWIRTGKIEPSEKNYWRVYFRTTRMGIITRIELLRVIKDPFPIPIEPKGEVIENPEDLFRMRGKILEIGEKGFALKIERNGFANEGSPELQYFYLNLKGELPSEAETDQFWEIMCIRDEDYLKLIKGRWINEKLTNNWDKELEKQGKIISVPPKNKKKQKPSQTAKKSPTESTVIESPIIMLNGKQPEMTVKFTERPELPEQGKKVTLQVTGENGIVVKAEVNRKTLAKQVQKMDSFADWVAAFSGKVLEITTDGVVILEAANVQVFQRKQKVKEEEKESNNDN